MEIKISSKPWVVAWFIIGVMIGAVAVVNIAIRDLRPSETYAIWVVGFLHWGIFGIICWASQGLKFKLTWSNSPPQEEPGGAAAEEETT